MKSPRALHTPGAPPMSSPRIETDVATLISAAAPFVEECRSRRAALSEISSKRGALPADLRAARLRFDSARQQVEQQRAAANARRIANLDFDAEPLAAAEQSFEIAGTEVKRLEDLDCGIVGAMDLLREDLDASHDKLDEALRPVRERLHQQAVEKYRRAVADLRDAVELVRAMNNHITDSDVLLPPIDREMPPFQFCKPSAEVSAIADVVRPAFFEQHRTLQRLLRN